MRLRATLLFLSITIACAWAQTTAPVQPLTLERIWGSRDLVPASFPGFQWHAGGKEYLEQTQAGLMRHDTKTGAELGLLIKAEEVAYDGKPIVADGFEVTEGSGKVLITSETKSIYRRSTKAHAYVLDVATRKVIRLDTALVQNAVVSPDGRHAAYMRANNVYVTDLATGQSRAITTDGKLNEIINGACDWVYEEEWEFAQAIYWAPDGKHLAFYRFDERRVPEYDMQTWGKSLYPSAYRYKYPKTGEANSEVSVLIYEVSNGKTVQADAGSGDQYIARTKWTADPNVLSLIRMDRLQQKFELLHCQAATGACQAIYSETDKAYVEVNDNLFYLPKTGKQQGFVLTSERDGYRHIYLHGPDGKPVRQLTKGPWEVLAVHGISAKGVVYFSARKKSPTRKEVYSVPLSGGEPRLLTPQEASHTAEFAPACDFFVDVYSTAATAPVTVLCQADGKLVKTLETNKAYTERITALKLPQPEFVKMPGAAGNLEGFIIRPPGMQAGKKYPVLQHFYGGSGRQVVEDDFSYDLFWFGMLAQQGYIVVAADNRGTDGRGAAFRKSIYGQLGKLEAEDQAAITRHLATLPYVDASRIGVFGWSFGGYLTSLLLTRYPELYKAGIAVAPVTNWRFYDSIYTERFLGLPKDNAAGYDDNSPVTLAARLKSKYLLVHGTGDDNVHFQNSIQMTNALVREGIPFEQAYYPDRHHGISGGRTRLHLYGKMTEFLKRSLMD